MKRYGLLITFFLSLSCSQINAAQEPVYGGTLIFGRGADSTTLDPALANDGESSKVLPSIFEKLVDFKENSTELCPSLATSWESDPLGKIWVFNLKKGVKFHDGTPFNSDAVIFSIKRQIDPEHPFYRGPYPNSMTTFTHLKKLKKLGTYRIRMELSKPYAPFLRNLAHHSAAIVSPSAVKKSGDAFERTPVGTGPFRFEKWLPEDRIILNRYTQYHGGMPYIEKLVFKTIRDNQDRVVSIKSSSIDAMDGVEIKFAPILRKNENLRLKVSPGMNVGFLSMNMDKKPFDDLRVRKAVYHAINKKKMVKLMFQDLAVPAVNPMPPAVVGYNHDIREYPYDPATSRKLLADAGFPDGFKTTLWVMPVPRPYMPDPSQVAMAIKANLAVVGITVKVVSHDWQTYLSKLFNGEHDLCLLGMTGDNGDPDNFLYSLFHSDNAVRPNAQNTSFFRNTRVDKLLETAMIKSSLEERVPIYINVQEIIHGSVPMVPLVHTKQMICFRKNVHGIVQQPTENLRFNRAWID